MSNIARSNLAAQKHANAIRKAASQAKRKVRISAKVARAYVSSFLRSLVAR
jgi:hypothetical protein